MSKNEIKKCPCGSGKNYSHCCEKYIRVPKNYVWGTTPKTILFDWINTYSPPIANSFIKKVRPYVFRISCCLDAILDQYFNLELDCFSQDKEKLNDAIDSIKYNILHTFIASFSCLAQGLFIQSGILIRSMIEDSLVLIDFIENSAQVDRFLKGKYSTNGLLSRVKIFIPDNITEWYGYFSANFTHFGPIHPAPYLPTGCYADNTRLVIGLQNMVRAVVTFQTVLERIYYDKTDYHVLWNREAKTSDLIFNEDSQIFEWSENLGKEILSNFPPGEVKEGFVKISLK